MTKRLFFTLIPFALMMILFSQGIEAKHPYHGRLLRFRYQKNDGPHSASTAHDIKSQKGTDSLILPVRGVSAHRGESVVFPENTIPAFLEAARLGAHQIEFDVCTTKDEQFVVLHDLTVDRTTNGKGKISEMTFQEARQLDAGIKKGERFRSTKIPTLDEALDCMPRNIWLNVHLKGNIDAAYVANKIREKNRLHQAFLACSLEQAKAARSVCPDIMICNMSRKPAAEYVNQTIANKCQFIQIIKKKYTPLEIVALHRAGVRVNCFGIAVKDPDDLLKTMFDDGIDFPLVDRLDDMLREAEKYGIPRWTPVWDNASQ